MFELLILVFVGVFFPFFQKTNLTEENDEICFDKKKK